MHEDAPADEIAQSPLEEATEEHAEEVVAEKTHEDAPADEIAESLVEEATEEHAVASLSHEKITPAVTTHSSTGESNIRDKKHRTESIQHFLDLVESIFKSFFQVVGDAFQFLFDVVVCVFI